MKVYVQLIDYFCTLRAKPCCDELRDELSDDGVELTLSLADESDRLYDVEFKVAACDTISLQFCPFCGAKVQFCEGEER